MSESRTLAIIPARGGSKRIPRKNVRPFLGKPILAYSIEAARASGVFEEVMVSTDDPQIATVASEYGAATPFMRHEATSNDHATTAAVLLEVLDEYEKRGRTFTHVCCIYPTAPFVTAEVLQEAQRRLLEAGAETAMTVSRFSFPPQRALVIRDGQLGFLWPENALRRSQDLEPAYQDAGQLYFLDVSRFRETGQVVMKHAVPILREEFEVQDIDNESDWKIAELKYGMTLARRS